MNQSISRETRICYLTIGFCIMLLFYIAVRKNMTENQSFNDTENKAYSLFNLDFAKKYLVLAWSLTQQTSDPRCLQLVSLGTHFLEHFFGKNRRVNNGSDTAENFERAIQFHLLSSTLQKDLNIHTTQPKRVSSSGANFLQKPKNLLKCLCIMAC